MNMLAKKYDQSYLISSVCRVFYQSSTLVLVFGDKHGEDGFLSAECGVSWWFEGRLL